MHLSLSLTPTFKRWLLLGVGAAMLASLAVMLGLAAKPAGAQAGWQPVVEIDVPFRDEDNDGTNDYTARFPITFTRTSAASTDSPAGSCPVSASLNVRIGAPGILNANGNQLLARGTLSRSGGFSAGCEFSVALPDTMASGVSGVTLTRASSSPATVTVSSSSSIAASDYGDGRTTFESGIRFNGFDATAAGTDFTVTYTNHTNRRLSHAACELHDSLDQETFEVQADGSVQRTSAAAPLINTPAGANLGCRYSIGWPEVPGWSRDSGSASTIQPSARTPSATYNVPAASRFMPNVTIVAPFVDIGLEGMTADDNQLDFYDSDPQFNNYINVTFRRSGGPITGCSDDTTKRYYTAAAARTVGGEELVTFTVEPFDLIDNPQGEEERYCTYAVSFANNDEWQAYTKIADIDTDDVEVHGDESNQNRAHATYTTKERPSGGPRLAVTAPTSAAGERISVDVTSSDDGCTERVNPDAILIGADGSGNVPLGSLVNLPQGYTRAADYCTYIVNWAPYENRALGTAPTLRLGGAVSSSTIPSGFTYTLEDGFSFAEASAVSNGRVTATYEAYSSFIPSLNIFVPPYDAPGGGTFFGTATSSSNSPTVYPMRIRPKAGSPDGCTSDETYSYLQHRSATTIQPASMEQPVLTNVPAGQPGGATEPCVYIVTFPETVSSSPGDTPAWTLRITDNSDAEIQAGAARIDRNYLADAINLDFAVDIKVPQYNDAGGTNNAFAGTVFTAQFAPRTGASRPATGCTAAFSRDFTVQNNGDVTGAAVELVHRPGQQNLECEYDVTLTVGASTPPLVRASGATTVLSGLTPTLSARYDTHLDTSFTIIVTDYDADGTTTNAFSGEEIIVGVARATGPTAGCTTGDTTFTVDDDANAIGPLVLVDGVGGEDTRCAYTISFPQNEDGGTRLIRQGAQDRTVETATPAFTVLYRAAATNFTPPITISVPYVDASGANALANETVTVTYSLHVTIPAQHDDCTSTSPTETWTIGSGGSRNTGGEIVRGTPASLVDRPEGQTARCRYIADVTDSLPLPGGDSITLATDNDNQDFIKTEPFTVVYVGDTFFTPPITISVPPYERDGAAGTNYYEGTTFEVSYTVKSGEGPPSGCSTGVTQTYTVGDDGAATLTAGPPTLVNVPRTESAGCVYVAAFEQSRSSAQGATPVWTLRNRGAATADVSDGAATVTVSYTADEITFVPTFAITVPQVVGLTAGENLFAGQTFAVSVVREANSHADCSLAQSTSVSYAVDAGGTVSAARAEPSLATLVDYPAGEDSRCSYTVMFDRSRSSAPGDELSWRLTPGATPADATVTLTAAEPAATGAYAADAITYFPDTTIAVPTYSGDEDDPNTDVDESTANAFVALKMDVAFASAPSGCTDQTLTFTVQPDSLVTPDDQSDAVALVAYPAGSDTLCAYGVTFPPNETTGARLELQSGSSTSVSGVAQAIAARYLAAETTFVPDIEVVVPFIDASPADEMNDLAQLGASDSDRTVTLSYAPDEGADARCLAATETYRIDASARDEQTRGRATRTEAPVMLVDRPAGEDDRCTYALTVEEADTLVDELPVRSFNPNVPIPIAAIQRAVTLSYSARSLPAPIRAGAASDTRLTSTGPTRIGSDFAELEGFVATDDPRLSVMVSVALPEAGFELGATVEVLLSSPGACGADMLAFGGVPASVGLAYAVGAESGATLMVAQGAHALAAFAERDDDGSVVRQPCALRVTVLSAPAGCTLAGGASGGASDGALTDDAGRSYVEQTWTEGAEAFSLTPSLACASPS